MLTLSPFQQFLLALIIFAVALVAYLAGRADGRLREACEPTQKIDEDDGETFGSRHV